MAEKAAHAPSDMIEEFDLNDDSARTFERPEFTAIAHPSSLDIDRTHGVFVLEENGGAATALTELRSCLRVLQKPQLHREQAGFCHGRSTVDQVK